MKDDVKERIDSYVEMYKDIWDKTSKSWPDNQLEVSDRIFQEISKDLRSEMIFYLRTEANKSKQLNKTGYPENEVEETSLATKKQKQTLHKFGIEKIPTDLSKEEASEILEELIDLSRHGNKDILKEQIETLNEKWILR